MRYLWVILLCTFVAQPGTGAADASRAQPKARGQSLYISKCAKCHPFYNPSDYSITDWSKWMVKMKKKSKLGSADYEAVLNYTLGLREQPKALRPSN